MISVDPDAAVLWILNGTIGASKAITVLERDIELPPLTEKDRQAIEIGNRADQARCAVLRQFCR